MKPSFSAVLFAFAALLIGTGCGSDHSPTSPPLLTGQDVLTLTTITPRDGNSLPVGTVRFDATLHYEFASATSGRMTVLSIATGHDGELTYLVTRELQQLSSRRADVNVSFAATLPEQARGSRLGVVFSVLPDGSLEGTAQAHATYLVGP